MPATRDDVLAALDAAFPAATPDQQSALLAQLDGYGSQPHERERERVQLAILALCDGDGARLADLVRVARTDYRDVLAWQATGPLAPAQGQVLQAQARQLIARLGKP